MYQQIAWQEGMLLQPQHFQQQDRHVAYLLRQHLQLLHRYYWGFSELELNHELLSIGKFGVTRVKAIFADGSVYQAPDVDALPTVIDIPDQVKPQHILLSLPLTNTSQDKIPLDDTTSSELRYRIKSISITDITKNHADTITAHTATLHPTLMLYESHLSAHTTLPVARILEKSSDNQIHLDSQYIPPFTDSLQNTHLQSIIEEILGLTAHYSQYLSKPLQGLAFNDASLDTAQLWLLQQLNRFAVQLLHYSQQSPFHPEILHQLLLTFHQQIFTLLDESHCPKTMLPYQHTNIRESIYPLCEALRTLLKQTLQQPVLQIPLLPQSSGVWMAKLDDLKNLESTAMVLAVYAEMPISTLQNTLPKQMKTASSKSIQNLVNRSLPGIGLQLLPVAPRQIPHQANHSYFLLETNHDEWQQALTSQTLAFHLSGSYPAISLELWAIRGKR